MDSNVESKQLDEGIVLAEAEKSCQVPRIILVGVDGRKLATAIDVAVDATSDAWQLGNPTMYIEIDV